MIVIITENSSAKNTQTLFETRVSILSTESNDFNLFQFDAKYFPPIFLEK